MLKDEKIYLAGHTGLVGSAIKRALSANGYENLTYRNLSELDLRLQRDVDSFFKEEKPAYVILAAAKVGGIYANNRYRAEFIYDNLMIQSNIINASYKNNVKKLLFLGSSCIYPREAPQPMREDYLLTSPLEYTNESYAIAKIAGIKTCESYNLQYGTNYISVMPTNLYGPGDNFNLLTSHVLPALLRKIHLAKCLEEGNIEDLVRDFTLHGDLETETINNTDKLILELAKFGIEGSGNKVNVEIWGTGKPKREFLWIDDMADACVQIMNKVDFSDILKAGDINKEVRNTHINIGTGTDVSIKELAIKIKEIVGFKGDLVFNESKPDGTPRKLMDVSLLHKLGWKHKVELDEGLKKLYQWYTFQ